MAVYYSLNPSTGETERSQGVLRPAKNKSWAYFEVVCAKDEAEGSERLLP